MRLAILLALGLSACASTQSILASAPDEVWQSDKNAADVAFCIATRNNTVSMERGDGSRVVQIKNLYGVVGVAYVVRSEGDGSVVEVRRANSPISFTRSKACL
jgi:hypothetical protein